MESAIEAEQSAEHAAKRPIRKDGPYAWFVLSVFMLAYMVSFIDRQLLTLLVGPIRATLHISDFQLSLLHGFAFAMFYTVLGMPIGRLVDRSRRTTVIAIGITVWSIMTALCGLARSFGQLFLARVGVGVGEAALSPGAYSMLSDCFSAHQLPRALSFYNGAANVGAGFAIMAGGALIALMPAVTLPGIGMLEPWQAVFIAVGLPGVLVALLVLALREPPRTGLKSSFGGEQPRIGEVFAYLAERRAAFGTLMIGYAVAGLVWNGSLAWLPTFFMRIHGWSVGDVAWRYGLAIIGAGSVGVIIGSQISIMLRARGHEDANIKIGLLSLGGVLPFGLASVLVQSDTVSILLVFVFFTFCSFPFGSAAAALQEITPNQMRGQVAAIYLFCLSFFGMGLGPAIVANFTDNVFGYDGALGYSLAITIAIVVPIAAFLLWRACGHYRAALARNDF
ncbi:spinster family MFS transporter [Sphingobium tyrosinilyticum]|uniref:Spinster family MFS transporter n=1 Tax=Sphingobium tyrosinilyticum TaxID=2715436 RepID=A0ABV9F359_9SPHN